MLRFLFAVVLAFPAFACRAQSADEFTQLVSKTWRLGYMVVESDTMFATEEDGSDSVVYRADGTLLIVEGADSHTGSWRYDAAQKQITIADDKTKKEYTMTVVSITTNTFDIRYNDPETGMYSVHLVPTD